MPSCWRCRSAVAYKAFESVPRESECETCGWDLHSCKNCRHHDPGVNNQCREPNAEWVTDREKASFCDLFQLADTPRGAGPGDRAAAARKKLDDLFGGLR